MIFRNKKPTEEKTLITTRTGEAYQPVRLYYQVFNPKTVVGAFKKLRCMLLDPDSKQHWQWLYDQETKRLKFTLGYNKIPKEHRPIVLGDFYFRGETLILDVRSFDRALTAVQFFDKRINRRAARITRMRLVNRYFDMHGQPSETLHPPFDHFFEREDLVIPDASELEEKLAQLTDEYEDMDARMKAVNDFLEEKNKQPLPEIEEIPVHFYEDGIGALQLALAMRQIEAMRHWQGDTSFSQYDVVQQMLATMMDKLDDEEFDEALSDPEED